MEKKKKRRPRRRVRSHVYVYVFSPDAEVSDEKVPRALTRKSTVAVRPGIGTLPLFGLTAQFSKTPGAVTGPPPRLSADTADVLAGIGISREALPELKTKGVI